MTQTHKAAAEEKAASAPKRRKKKKALPICVNLANCKYDVVRTVLKKLSWKEVGDDDHWHLYWTDTSVAIERVMRLSKTQKINHFTGMLEICRKKRLSLNLGRMRSMFRKEYDFTPNTFVLPAEVDDFLAQLGKGKRQTYILKPDSGCQGKGISLVQTVQDARAALEGLETENVVAQKYLTKPLLIDGYKFDLRIYILVVSCDPLRMFMFKQGLVRFCTEKYEAPKAANLDVSCMHLTNYAVNKRNDKFVFNQSGNADDGEGSKWSLEALREWMDSNGQSYEDMMSGVADLAIKTVISIQPLLAHNYRSVLPEDNDGFSCFEILGLDVLIDAKSRPWLVEVNHSPSFTTDTPLDLSIKEALISDTISLAHIDSRAIRKHRIEERKGFENRLYAAAQRWRGAREKAETSSSAGTQRQPSGSDAAATGTGEKKETPVVGTGKRTKEELEAHRAALLESREAFESKILPKTSYERIYPVPEGTEERQAVYDRLLQGAKEIFNRMNRHTESTASKMASQRERPNDTTKMKVAPPKTEPKKSKLAHVASKVVATLNSNRAELARREAASAKAASGPAAPTCEARSASAEQSAKEASSSSMALTADNEGSDAMQEMMKGVQHELYETLRPRSSEFISRTKLESAYERWPMMMDYRTQANAMTITSLSMEPSPADASADIVSTAFKPNVPALLRRRVSARGAKIGAKAKNVGDESGKLQDQDPLMNGVHGMIAGKEAYGASGSSSPRIRRRVLERARVDEEVARVQVEAAQTALDKLRVQRIQEAQNLHRTTTPPGVPARGPWNFARMDVIAAGQALQTRILDGFLPMNMGSPLHTLKRVSTPPSPGRFSSYQVRGEGFRRVGDEQSMPPSRNGSGFGDIVGTKERTKSLGSEKGMAKQELQSAPPSDIDDLHFGVAGRAVSRRVADARPGGSEEDDVTSR